MKTISLNGTWQVRRADTADTFDAQVPGTIHQALLAAGRIDDPYVGERELDVQWIGGADWIWKCCFELAADLLNEASLELVFEGLDTLASLELNGVELGQSSNMHRRYAFNAKPAAQAGGNELTVRFASPLPLMRGREEKRHLETVSNIAHEPPGRSWVRKEACNFGWDWGPVLITCGVWKAVSLCAWSGARTEELRIEQRHAESVSLGIALTLDRPAASGERMQVTVRLGEQTVAVGTACFDGTGAELNAVIGDPRLWWPAGMGDQPLYEVQVDYVGADGTVRETIARRVGLRTLEVVRETDAWGESFFFRCNGVPFFAKGSNWIPSDAMRRDTAEHRRRLLKSAVEANQNTIRVWGGGIYEMDDFYDSCDELGLCVWQDFMFACAAYPADEPGFLENVRREAIDQIRRLRHHPSIALWCGNNELEMRWVGFDGASWPKMPLKLYEEMFDGVLAEAAAQEDPSRTYWPCSPHTPGGDRSDFNNPARGDAHLWDVWHGMAPFEWYRTALHRFCSEFGFQSYPEPRTISAYAQKQELNITSPVMEFHQRSPIGNARIIHYMLSWFRMPKDFESTVWLSQIQQGLSIQYAVEHWRRNMPRCMGALYWQLNDCWPVASWSSIDWFGRWKALHYMARRFFAPLLISGVEHPEEGAVDVFAISDRAASCTAEAGWTLTDLAGQILESGSTAIDLQPRESRLVQQVDCTEAIRSVGLRNILVWLTLRVDGETVSENLVTFVKPKAMDLPDPGLTAEVHDGRVIVHSVRPSLWVWVESDGGLVPLSDQMVCLRAGETRTLGIRDGSLPANLRVRSLRDTY